MTEDDQRICAALQVTAEGHDKDSAIIRNFALLGAAVFAAVVNAALTFDLEVGGVVAETSGWVLLFSALALFITAYSLASWASAEASFLRDEQAQFLLRESTKISDLPTARVYMASRQAGWRKSRPFKYLVIAFWLSTLIVAISTVAFVTSVANSL